MSVHRLRRLIDGTSRIRQDWMPIALQRTSASLRRLNQRCNFQHFSLLIFWIDAIAPKLFEFSSVDLEAAAFTSCHRKSALRHPEMMPLLISSIVRGVNCWTIRVQGAPVALYADGTFRSMSESYLTIIPCRPLGWPHAQLVHAPRPRPRRRLQGSRRLVEERGPRRSVKHRFGGSPFSICLRTLRPGAVRRAAGTRPGSRYKLLRWAQYYSGRQVL
jgi:hypothetical protein